MKLQDSAAVYPVLEVEGVTTVSQVSTPSPSVENVTVIGMALKKRSVMSTLATVFVRAMWSALVVISVTSTPITLTLAILGDVHSASVSETQECAGHHL